MFELIEKFGHIFCNNLTQEIVFNYFNNLATYNNDNSFKVFEKFNQLCPNINVNDYYNIVILICLTRINNLSINCLDEIDSIIKENNVKKNDFFRSKEISTKRIDLLKKKLNKNLPNLSKFIQSLE